MEPGKSFSSSSASISQAYIPQALDTGLQMLRDPQLQALLPPDMQAQVTGLESQMHDAGFRAVVHQQFANPALQSIVREQFEKKGEESARRPFSQLSTYTEEDMAPLSRRFREQTLSLQPPLTLLQTDTRGIDLLGSGDDDESFPISDGGGIGGGTPVSFEIEEKSNCCCCPFLNKICSIFSGCFKALGSAFGWVLCCGCIRTKKQEEQEENMTRLNADEARRTHQLHNDMADQAHRQAVDMHNQATANAMNMHQTAVAQATTF